MKSATIAYLITRYMKETGLIAGVDRLANASNVLIPDETRGAPDNRRARGRGTQTYAKPTPQAA